MKTRIITALVFGVIMISGTILSRETCAILYIAVGMLCLWELSGLLLVQDSKAHYNLIRRIFAVFIGLLPALLVLDTMLSPYPIVSSGYGHWFFPLFFGSFIFELRAASSKPFHNIAFTLLGILYIGLPTALLTAISLKDASGRFLIMAIVLMVWANDVFAYFSGKALGRHKIFPRISPNKTWEGTIGGFISALLWGVVSYYIWTVGVGKIDPLWAVRYSIGQWIVLAAVCSIFGIIGDLVASMLKRSLSIKDTGNTLPGHGGLIDRFDAFIFALPFVAFTIRFIFEDSTYIISW